MRFPSRLLRRELVFGRSVAVDLCWLDGRPVLHVVCEETGFGGATFVPCKGKNPTSVEVWLALLRCWILLYVGPPHRLKHDPGTNFASNEFKYLLGTSSTRHAWNRAGGDAGRRSRTEWKSRSGSQPLAESLQAIDSGSAGRPCRTPLTAGSKVYERLRWAGRSKSTIARLRRSC